MLNWRSVGPTLGQVEIYDEEGNSVTLDETGSKAFRATLHWTAQKYDFTNPLGWSKARQQIMQLFFKEEKRCQQ